jgi:hypothetical protein
MAALFLTISSRRDIIPRLFIHLKTLRWWVRSAKNQVQELRFCLKVCLINFLRAPIFGPMVKLSVHGRALRMQ